MNGHVFISYNRNERSYVEDLSTFLRAAGLSVWYDQSLVAGEAWSRTLQHAIRDCSACVVIMSPSSSESRWVEREISWAEGLSKPVVPLLYDGDVFFRLIDLHYDDVRGGRMPSSSVITGLASIQNGASHSTAAALQAGTVRPLVNGDSKTGRPLDADSSISPGVLYVMVCGSPMAQDVGILVDFAQRDGWEVCVVTTPDGRQFVDAAALQAQTGHAVRTYRKHPKDLDILPPADAIIVAPATANTLNKWASGISDTLLLNLLVEAYGYGIPVVVMPYENRVAAMHPSFKISISQLRDWGVIVLYGDDVVRLGGPGQEDRFRSHFPWRRALDGLSVSAR